MSLLRKLGALAVLAAAASLAGCGDESVEDFDWAYHGFDREETRYSPLDQIDRDNISRLGLAWSLDLPGENDLEGTPLEVGGVLYFSGGMGRVYAVSVETGELLWDHDPKAGERLTNSRRMGLPVNRGVAYEDGSVFVATRDGRMIALDAATGDVQWTTQFLLPDDGTTSTGAPRVCGSNVIIGNAGSESLSRGYATAMNRETGEVAWRFFIVPGNPAVDDDWTTQQVADTWGGEWWRYGGGGNPWNAMTCDEELGQFLIGTGNAAPYALEMRTNEGEIQDNLFLASLLAVDTETGEYRWHYQHNPGEQWDWKSTMDITLTEMEFDGETHKVALQAPSNGFFYVVDRTDGRLLAAEDYGKQNWAERIDLETGRPVETANARYGEEPVTIYPGVVGTHNWQAMAVNTDRMIAYIPAIQIGMTYAVSQEEIEKVRNRQHEGFFPSGIVNGPIFDSEDPRDDRGSLIAWDVAAQEIAWEVEHPTHWNSGLLVTRGGLVFQGLESGELVAYNDESGEQLWSFDAQLGIMAPPITYSHNGKQYVSVLVGYGGSGGYGLGPARELAWVYGEQPRRLLTFVLDGEAQLPEPGERTHMDETPPVLVPDLVLDDAKVALGGELYNYSCSYCHFAFAMGAGAAPDLRSSQIAANREAFETLMRSGAFADSGMPKFDDLTSEEIEGLYQFIRYAARASTDEEGIEVRAR